MTAGKGVAFGCALNLLTHESALPLLGLSDAPTKQRGREQASEAVTHTVYGVVTEVMRAWVRAKI